MQPISDFGFRISDSGTLRLGCDVRQAGGVPPIRNPKSEIRNRRSGLLALTALAAGGSAHCAPTGGETASGPSYARSAEENYERGMEALESDNCVDAQRYFEQVMRRFPYSRAATLSRLRMADCDFEQGNYRAAATGYRGFIERYPSDEMVDYAMFRRGLSHFELIPSSWFVLPASHERDQTPTREALRELREFVDRFPASAHVDEARARIRDCLAELARSELSVAEFYLDRGRPAAAARRARVVLREYPESGLAPEALLMLGIVALDAGDRDAALSYFGLLAARHRESHEASRALRYLRFMQGTAEGGD